MLAITACYADASGKFHRTLFRAGAGFSTQRVMRNPRRNFIGQWRRYKNVKAAELIERLEAYGELHGIKVPTSLMSLSRIEGAKQNFSIDFLHAVADVLATGKDDPTPGDLLNINPFAGALDATRTIEQMSPRQRRIAQGVLTAMLQEDQKNFEAGPSDT